MHELLGGGTIDVSRITREESDYLDEIARDVAAGRPALLLELRVKGPGAFPTRKTGGFVTKAVLEDPVYRVANDLVARAGIQQGSLAPPRDAKPGELLSVPEAASVLGTTRQNVNAAISRGAMPAQKVGETWVLRLEDVRAYQARAAKRPAPGRAAPASRERSVSTRSGPRAGQGETSLRDQPRGFTVDPRSGPPKVKKANE